jgi:hypothetical protein
MEKQQAQNRDNSYKEGNDEVEPELITSEDDQLPHHDKEFTG